MNPTDTIQDLFEKSKTNKKTFKALKAFFVETQDYELVAKMREIEKESFPETEEEKLGETLKQVFAMVSVRVEPKMAWLLYKTSLLYSVNGMNTDLKQTSKLLAQSNEIFE